MYPLSELLTGLTFVGVAYYTGVFKGGEGALYNNLNFVYFLIIACFYIVLFLTDAKYKLIPNVVVYPAIVFSILYIVFSQAYVYIDTYNKLEQDPFGKYLIQAGFMDNYLNNTINSFASDVLSSVGIAFFFWFLVKITKGRGMGEGDIRLGFLIGFVNKFPNNILAIFLGFVFGAVYGIGLVLLKRSTVKDTIAFGPFLIAGSVVAILWGPELINYYINLF